ncbi:unnamed protein product [Effrenium voratum]|uniref:thioredoxin-dependent peroxiredoxin n=1 Tax=Effrenium voratum TaxID=2562239 RepID=A0AA36JKC8_9DINO|nr:unnamed protein product [Effrenium voratum]
MAMARTARSRKALLPALALGVLGCAFVAPVERSAVRRLLLAGHLGMLPSAANAQEKGYQEASIRIGSSFQVLYDGAIPNDDFFVSPGLADFGTDPLSSPKVLFVKPTSKAYAQGLRVGDELKYMSKIGIPGMYSEGQIRKMRDVDKEIKRASNASSLFGYEKLGMEVGPGLYMEFKANGVVQPGEQAPDFKLPASSGGQLALSELLAGNEFLVVFFRPSSRFRGGDLQEVQLFNRAQKDLAARGATVVGIQMEPITALMTQANAMDLGFPMLCDFDGSVARAYGAYLELEEQGPNTDRKTFIIGKDGKVKTSFVDVGYDADKKRLKAHVADVVRVLGGDPQKALQAMQPKSKSVGEMLDIAVGRAPPSPRIR